VKISLSTTEIFNPGLRRLGWLRLLNVLQRLVKHYVTSGRVRPTDDLPIGQAPPTQPRLLELDASPQGKLDKNAATEAR